VCKRESFSSWFSSAELGIILIPAGCITFVFVFQLNASNLGLGSGGSIRTPPKIEALKRTCFSQLFEKDEEVTPKAVKAKLQELLTQRGRKGTNKHEFVATLEALLDIVKEKNLGTWFGLGWVGLGWVGLTWHVERNVVVMECFVRQNT
jgi:hypothetical protein